MLPTTTCMCALNDENSCEFVLVTVAVKTRRHARLSSLLYRMFEIEECKFLLVEVQLSTREVIAASTNEWASSRTERRVLQVSLPDAMINFYTLKWSATAFTS